MPGLIDWLGKRVKDAENFVGGAVNNVSHFVGDVANNVNRAVAPRPQAPQQRPTVQQPQQPQQGGIARPNGTGGLFTQPSAPSIQQQRVQTVQQPTVQNGLNANVNLSQNKIQTQPAPIDGLTKLFGDTIHTAQNAVGDVVNNGAKIVNGIGNGVNTAVNVEKNVAGNVANTVVNNAPKLLNQAAQNGQNLAKGVVAAPTDFVKATGNGLSGFAGGAARGFMAPAADIVNNLATGFDRQEAQKRTNDFMRTTGLNNFAKGNNTGSKIGETIGGFAGGIVPGVVKAGVDLAGGLGTNLGAANFDTSKIADPYGRAAVENYLAGQAVTPRETLVNAGETALNVLAPGAGKLGAALKVAQKPIDYATGSLIGGAFGGLETARDPNAKASDYAKNIAAGALGGVAIPAVGDVTRLAAKGGVKAADTTQSAIMQKAHDNLVQTDPTYAQQATLAQTMAKNIKAASDAGATPQELAPHLQNLNTLTQQMQGRMNRQLEGGFAKVPGGSDNVKPPIEAYSNHADPFESNFVNEQVAAHSSPEQYRQQMIDKIWSDNKKGKGVDTWYTYDHPDGQGGGTHINGRGGMSNNSLFYQEFYKQNGYKPTKKAITELVDKELNGEPTILSEQGEIAPNHIESSIYRSLQERKAANESRVEPQSAKTSELAANVPREQLKNQGLPQKDQLPQPQKQASTPTQEPTARPMMSNRTQPGRIAESANNTVKSTRTSELAARANQTDSQPYPYRTAGNQSSPSVKPMLPHEAAQYAKAMTKAQEAARKREFGGTLGKLKHTKDEIKRYGVDRFAPIEDTLRIAKKNGAKVPIKNDIHYQIDRALRTDQLSSAYMRDHGLDKIVQKVPNTKEFDQYIIAKHGQKLSDLGIKTGRDTAKDAAYVKAMSGKYEQHAQDIYKYSQNLLDKSVEYGLISKDAAKSLKKQYPDYVPFNRIFADGEVKVFQGNGGNGKLSRSTQTVVQKIKGSQRQVESPLASIINKTEDVINQGEQNKAAQMLASYKDLPGNPFQLKEIKLSETIGVRNTIAFLENGKKRVFETTPEIAAAAKHLDKEQLNILGKVMAAPARVLRVGATGANAAFTLANVAKDVATAFINSENGRYMASPKALKNAAVSALNHGSKQHLEVLREGAGGTAFDISRNDPRMTVRKLRAGKNFGSTTAYNVRHPGDLFRAFENTIGRSEEFGRSLQYFSNKQAAIKKGLSTSEASIYAADAARNNSVNFARAGEYGRVLNSVIPYLNAGVQGSRTFVRNMKEQPVATSAKVAAVALIPMASVTQWNMSDPERKKAYENISDYEKQNNIIIVPPHPKQDKSGKWNVIKIPLSQEIANPANIVRMGVEAANGGKKFDIGQAAGDVTATVTSLNADPRQLLNQVTPQVVKAPLETATNTNLFTGQKVVPDAVKNLDAKDQYNNSTSGTARVIGKALNVSPMQIDNFIKTSFGGLGQNIVYGSDYALSKTGAIKNEDIKGKDVLSAIAGRFEKAQGLTQGAQYFQSFEQAAKNNKLNGRDYEQLNALLAKETDQNGVAQQKNEKDKMTMNGIYANSDALIKTRADAAKIFAKETGQQVDPLFNLPIDKQRVYYQVQSLPKGSADQRNIQNKNPWLTDLSQQRNQYFNSIKDSKQPTASGLVAYPEQPKRTQDLLDQYNSITDSAARVQFMKDHPEVSKAFDDFANYTNDVRKAQGFDPLRTYQQPSERVQKLLDSGNKSAYNDPEVAQWMQNNAIYTLTKGAALAQIQGNDLSSSTLKNMNSLAQFNMVKNPDGSYALKYKDTQGSDNQPQPQQGAVATNSYGRAKTYRPKSSTRRVARGGGRRSGSGTSSKTSTSKLVSIYKASLNTKTPTVKSFKPGGTSAVSTPKLATVKLAKTVKKRSVKTSTLAKNVTITKKKGVVYKV